MASNLTPPPPPARGAARARSGCDEPGRETMIVTAHARSGRKTDGWLSARTGAAVTRSPIALRRYA
jgi:hypothetical protein